MIRGILVALTGTILLISLIVLGVSWDLSSSLKYNQVQNQAVNIFTFIDQEINITQALNNNLPAIREYCILNSDFVFSYQGYVLDISCSDINNSTSAIVNNTIKNFIGSIYYKQYTCSYWNCFNNYSIPVFLVSEQSENYWNQVFYLSIAASVIISGILFLLLKKKKNLPLVVGTIMVISSLPIFGLGQLLPLLSNKAVSGIASLFFSESHTIFIRMIIIGIVLLFVGLVIELFEAEFKIYNMFSRNKDTAKKK